MTGTAGALATSPVIGLWKNRDLDDSAVFARSLREAPTLSKSLPDREAKERFFRNVTSHTFSLPADHTFDRTELHER